MSIKMSSMQQKCQFLIQLKLIFGEVRLKMFSYAFEYLKFSTVHGVSYIAAKRPLKIEKFVNQIESNRILSFVFRLFWALALVAVLACTTLLIEKMIVKLRDFPTILYLASNPISISEVIFCYQKYFLISIILLCL